MRIIVLNRPTFPAAGVYGTFTNSRPTGKEVELCDAQTAADYTRGDYPKIPWTGYAYSFKVIQGRSDQVFVPSSRIDSCRINEIRSIDIYNDDVIAQLHKLLDQLEKDSKDKETADRVHCDEVLSQLLKGGRGCCGICNGSEAAAPVKMVGSERTIRVLIAGLCDDPACDYCKETRRLIADQK